MGKLRGIYALHEETFNSWRAMRARCNNPRFKQYRDYGGRGIKCCERWAKFANFLEDMGERPEGHTLDRIDNDGHYEPGNCRWATSEEQRSNCRSNRMLEVNGKQMSVAQAAREAGLKYTTLSMRIRRNERK